ncbi:MAG: HIT family protein [Pseudomonadota bacterium]|nr:HIT family protein [Pseudomonadota bacterium]
MAYDQNNIFAKILRDEINSHKIYEDDHTLAFMDVMPQSPGHSLVIPKQAAESLFDLDTDCGSAILRTTQRVSEAVRDVFSADGIMLNQFNGSAAGQTVFHFHIHIVPRYDGISLGQHSKKMEAQGTLEEQAKRIRSAIN